MNKEQIKNFAGLMKKKSDLLMNYFLIGFFVTGLLFAFYYNTWKIAIGVGGLSLIAYYSAKLILKKSTLYQYVLSAVMGIFMAQFIYQTHGMFEMYFFAFIGSTILITFRNWKIQVPLAIVVITHHVIFGYLQFVRHDHIYFTQLAYMPLQTFIIHGILTIAIFSICGLWAYNIKKVSENQIIQSLAIGKLQEENKQKEALIAMSENLKITNDRLNEANRELRTIFNTIDEVLFSVDVINKHIIQLSAACEKITGYTRSDFVGDLDLWRKFISPNDIVCLININKKDSGKIVVNQCQITHKNSSLRWLEIKIIPSFDANGILTRIDGIAKDITEAKNSEEALEKSYKEIIVHKQLMKTTEKLAHFGSWQFNVRENSVQWSDETFRIYGYEPGERKASYELFLNHVHPEDLEYVTMTMLHAFENLNAQKLSFRVVDRKGRIKYLQAELVIIRDSEGSPIQVTGFKQDITEKVLLEKKLAEERRLKQQEITEAVITAQEKERSFLGEELHDNINPTLATVKLYMDSALENEDLRVSLIKDTKGFINIIMDDIRKISKSMLPPSLGMVSLVDALNDMIENIERVNDLNFTVSFNNIDETLIDDKLKLSIFRIFQEQINNILKHANAKDVTITLKQQTNSLILSIKDNGIGFDTTKKRDGVGLQNIFSRAEIHKGKVIVDSQIGNGCELLINFPNDAIFISNNVAKAS